MQAGDFGKPLKREFPTAAHAGPIVGAITKQLQLPDNLLFEQFFKGTHAVFQLSEAARFPAPWNSPTASRQKDQSGPRGWQDVETVSSSQSPNITVVSGNQAPHSISN